MSGRAVVECRPTRFNTLLGCSGLSSSQNPPDVKMLRHQTSWKLDEPDASPHLSNAPLVLDATP